MRPIDLRLGDVLRLRRPHPCGNWDFEVVRLGADIGLRCLVCGRRILLPRSQLERRIISFVRRNPEPELPADLELPGDREATTDDGRRASDQEPAGGERETAP